jgi:hypothetical protein
MHAVPLQGSRLARRLRYPRLYFAVEAPLLRTGQNGANRSEVMKLGRWKSSNVFEFAYVREDGECRPTLTARLMLGHLPPADPYFAFKYRWLRAGSVMAGHWSKIKGS